MEIAYSLVVWLKMFQIGLFFQRKSSKSCSCVSDVMKTPLWRQIERTIFCINRKRWPISIHWYQYRKNNHWKTNKQTNKKPKKKNKTKQNKQNKTYQKQNIQKQNKTKTKQNKNKNKTNKQPKKFLTWPSEHCFQISSVCENDFD